MLKLTYTDRILSIKLSKLAQWWSGHRARQSVEGKCTPYLEIHALRDFPDDYGDFFKYIMTICIAASFALMGGVFYGFDKQTQVQDEKMARLAAQSNTVLASLFPSNVRGRMFNNQWEDKVEGEDLDGFPSPYDGISEGVSTGADNVIADLYPGTTILFADIAGFTAWSSMQEPKQVFVLLGEFRFCYLKICTFPYLSHFLVSRRNHFQGVRSDCSPSKNFQGRDCRRLLWYVEI